jgi:diphthine-ammonia ligase
MLWTGGKDSSLALREAAGDGCTIRCLVTFAPPEGAFLAHPLRLIEMQAEALALPHHALRITAPYDRSYETALRGLREEMGIDCVITGDIAEVAGHPNWIRERSRRVGMEVHTPLWGRERGALLRQFLDAGFKAVFSCVDTRWLDESWVGRALDESAVAGLQRVREQNGLDLCGENGEYHTAVLDGPGFGRRLEVGAYSRRVADRLAYMEIREPRLAG